MKVRNAKGLADARDIFRGLLSHSGTTEKIWQQFFATHPHVLSESLPLRLEPQDIQALARPGQTEPDFIFYPRALQPIPFCGVIELKRPDSKIITIPRKNVAMLTRDAQTAARQGMQYAAQLRQEVVRQDQILFFGNDVYVFVIMGMTEEISKKLGDQVHREMIDRAIPRNVHFLTFDEILARIEARLPTPLAFHALVRSDAHVDYDAFWSFTTSRMPTCTYSGQDISTGTLRVTDFLIVLPEAQQCQDCGHTSVVPIRGYFERYLGMNGIFARAICRACATVFGILEEA